MGPLALSPVALLSKRACCQNREFSNGKRLNQSVLYTTQLGVTFCLLLLPRQPVFGQPVPSFVSVKSFRLGDCGAEPLAYLSFSTEQCFLPRIDQPGFQYSCSGNVLTIHPCIPEGGLYVPPANNSDISNMTETSSSSTTTTTAVQTTPGPNETTVAVETTPPPDDTTSIPPSPSPASNPELPDPLVFNTTAACRPRPDDSNPWEGSTGIGPADAAFEELRCKDLLFSDSGVWCGLRTFAESDCAGVPLSATFTIQLDSCEPQLGFEGTYWQRYTLDATGNLTFQRQCIDRACRTCRTLAPLPSPPSLPPVFSQALGHCIPAVNADLQRFGGSAQLWTCIEPAPETTPPPTTPKPKPVPPPPPTTTLRIVVLGEEQCLLGPTPTCLHPEKQAVMVVAIAVAMNVNSIFLRVTDVQHASEVSWETLSSSAASASAAKASPRLLAAALDRPAAAARSSASPAASRAPQASALGSGRAAPFHWQGSLPKVWNPSRGEGRVRLGWEGGADAGEELPWLRSFKERTTAGGEEGLRPGGAGGPEHRAAEGGSEAGHVESEAGHVGAASGGRAVTRTASFQGRAQVPAEAEELLERKQRALFDTYGSGAVYVTVAVAALTAADAVQQVVRAKVAMKDGSMLREISDALRPLRPEGARNVSVAFFGPDGAVATTANGTRLDVPAQLFPAFRDPEDYDAVDTCSLPASLDAYCTEHNNCFRGLFCRRGTCRPCEECRYDGDSTGEAPTNTNVDPPDFSCPRWNCPAAPVCSNQTSRSLYCPEGCPPVYDHVWMPAQCSAMIPDLEVDEELRQRELQDDCGSRPGDVATIGGISIGMSGFFLCACYILKSWFDRVEQRVIRDKFAMRDGVYRGPE